MASGVPAPRVRRPIARDHAVLAAAGCSRDSAPWPALRVAHGRRESCAWAQVRGLVGRQVSRD